MANIGFLFTQVLTFLLKSFKIFISNLFHDFQHVSIQMSDYIVSLDSILYRRFQINLTRTLRTECVDIDCLQMENCTDAVI